LHRFAFFRRTGPALLGSFAATALLVASVAYGADPPTPAAPVFTSGPTIQGDAFVGSTLTAVATWTAEPAATPRYQWRRCPADGSKCIAITGATAQKYVVSKDDLGARLGVKVTLKNAGFTAVDALAPTTDIVTNAPTPNPTPTPTPSPSPAQPPSTNPDPKPDPTSGSGSGESKNAFPEPVAPVVTSAAPTLLRPFPTVRIRGYFKRGGVRVTLLSVNAPHAAHISARCVGKGCPVRTVSVASAPARLRAFERFLRAGTLIQVRVTTNGKIGKYASFRIRAHAAPLRKDLCLMPGKTDPAACPTA
jgi:hypothetical protein